MEVTLRWQDVSYSVRRPRDSWWRRRKKSPDVRHILDNVSGQVSTGNLVAIVGASGAGKTTLLAAISRRIRGNKLAGRFTINGREIEREEMTSISGFVPQNDSLINQLTIEEHLTFIGQLKYSRTMSQDRRKITIQKILTQLGLGSLASSRIATLSGGERKKLNLATELLGEPSFLFCDEPTTGLDSFSALLVMKTLKNLSGTDRESRSADDFEMEIVSSDKELWDAPSRMFPKGIVCSIHQPTSDIFLCFSHIIILREGRVVFQGTPSEAERDFQEAGFVCPPNYNPIEFYVKIVAEQPELDLCREAESIDNKSESFRAMVEKAPPVWILQVLYLLKRSSIVAKRSMKEEITQSAIYLSISVILVLFYKNVGGTTQTSIQDISGLFFTICTEVIFAKIYAVIMSFSPQLPLIRRETGEKLFDLSAFYTATALMQIPRAIIEAFLFLGIIYAGVAFSGDFWTYFVMSVTFSIASVASMAYGFMISGLCVDEKLVQEISVPFDTISLILGGFYLNIGDLPYLKFLSLFFLTNEAISIQFWREIDYIECSATSCLRNGTDVLNFYSFGMDNATIWRDYLVMAIWFVASHAIGFLGLRHYVRKEGFY
ncbi:protein brown [Phlebotomus argentipes]|uniref:protein brown n=1 Tax=Phlebotomus argentipes TaxID=94469 RepID=UPI002892A565|nr:protein brown [Phlebotomus argentipes]